MEDKLTFNLTNDNGETIECEVLFTFHGDETNKDYIVYTDNTFDEYGNVKVYASTYTTDENGAVELEAITDESEWEMIDNLIATIQEEEAGCGCSCEECGHDCGHDHEDHCDCGCEDEEETTEE